MTPTSLIIVTDRGSLKAYKVNETPTRGPSLQLVQAFAITDAHGRMSEKMSDMAGRFSVGAGQHMSNVAERTHMDTETDRRIYKQLVDEIVKIVNGDGTTGWSFAAPTAIHAAIVELMPAGVRDRIVEHVKSDLVKIEPAKLHTHFRSLQPV